MFTKDIGIDLGTANTLVFMRGKGIIIREPSVVAVDTRTDKAKYVGKKAKEVIGRTPGSIIAVRPLKDGVIADFDITTTLLQEFIRKALRGTFFTKARVIICIPSGVTAVEKRAVKEAAEYEAQDKKRKEGIDVRNDADAMVFQTENALKEVGDKISADDKAKVQAEIDSLKAAIEKTNIESMTDAEIDELKAGKERLMNVAQPVFTKMYEAQNPNAGAGPQAGPQGDAGQQNYQNNNDDVVDGDYTEV